MSVQTDSSDRWLARSIGGLVCLAVLAPAFAWAASRVGYAEPMDNAVELAGATSEIVPTGVSLFSSYALPWFGPHLGTLAGALLGTALTLGVAFGVGRLLALGN